MERIAVGGACEVVLGPGAAAEDVLPPRPGRRRVAILTQPATAAVAEQVAATLASVDVAQRTLPDGDSAKTLAVVAEVYGWLTERGLGRSDTIVGVGGGALTDVAGFAAATYLRGIESVYVPTTLLAAVDAAIGGKTGVNFMGKNLVGAFWDPTRVVIDIAILDALPADLRRQGMAEALKAGLIADAELVAILERDGLAADTSEVVRRAVAVKAKVVAADPRETRGEREKLNYGHTVGHAVEAATGISHGEAIAIGMVAAAAAAPDYDDVDHHRALMEGLSLPVTAPAVERQHVLELLGRDKKRDAAGLRMVLLAGPQQPVVSHVDAAALDRALAAVGIGGDVPRADAPRADA